ncbi:MAG: phenylacetic acid degradation protein PaaN [Bordetella sp.]|nr:phenylacetic acid degradation protein PaaN [Bordetella sp.]
MTLPHHPIDAQAFQTRASLLARATQAIAAREHFSAYPDDPQAVRAGAREAGEAEFRAHLGRRMAIDADTEAQLAGESIGPWGEVLDVRYADLAPTTAVERAVAAAPAWAALPFEQRADVCMAMLGQLEARAFEMAYACMHCCGQPFLMAYQAGTAHALDRALEAIAYAVREMRSVPHRVLWERPMAKGVMRIEKTFDIVPRGVALVIGCATFPTWNSYPGLFASLVAGNPVIVKPHPAAVLPLAICVHALQDTLRARGHDANVVQLVVDTAALPKTTDLALDPAVRLIDFTGSTAFGDWLETNAQQAHVFTEKAGVNPLVIDGTRDFDAMVRNIATTLCLYSGQMCTTPQNIYVPAAGIRTPEGRRSPDDFRQALAAAVARLTANPARAGELLGAIQSDATLARIEAAACAQGMTPIHASEQLVHPQWPQARMRSPLILGTGSDEGIPASEQFGPISFVIEVPTAAEGLLRAARRIETHGAISWSVYAADEAFAAQAKAAAAASGTHLTLDMTGAMLVNQSAAFSDFHVSGRNRSGNACLSDAAFVLPRFSILQSRRYLG